MKSLRLLSSKQLRAIDFILHQPSTFFIAGMGEGKTVVTLATIQLMIATNRIKRALVVAPNDVAKLTWPYEVNHWVELQNLSTKYVRGTPKKRAIDIYDTSIQICFLSYENFIWLFKLMKSQLKGNPFDMLVFDESVKMSDASSKRFQTWKEYFSTFKYRLNLTAKPRPNSALQLYSQTYCLDSGEAFGHSFTKWRSQYFYQVGYSGYKWAEFDNTNEVLMNKIKHLCFILKGEDRPYELIEIEVKLPKLLQEQYKKLEEEMFIELDETEHVVPNHLVALSKCCQFVGGHLYLDTGKIDEKGNKIKKTHGVHDIKLKALEKLIRGELEHHRSLITYEYQHERDEICYRFNEVTRFDENKEQNKLDWNEGKIEKMAVYPGSSARGLNLQDGGSHLIWYTKPWSKDLWDQMIGRINRQGQTEVCKVYDIIVVNTVDVVKRALHRVREGQEQDFIEMITEYRRNLN